VAGQAEGWLTTAAKEACHQRAAAWRALHPRGRVVSQLPPSSSLGMAPTSMTSPGTTGMVVLLSGGKSPSGATSRREATRVSGAFPLDPEVRIPPGWGARGCCAGRAVCFSSEEGLPSTLTVRGWAGTAPHVGAVEMTLKGPGTGFRSSAPVRTKKEMGDEAMKL